MPEPPSLPWAQAFSRAWEPGVAGSHPQALTRTLAAAALAPNEEEEKDEREEEDEAPKTFSLVPPSRVQAPLNSSARVICSSGFLLSFSLNLFLSVSLPSACHSLSGSRQLLARGS